MIKGQSRQKKGACERKRGADTGTDEKEKNKRK